jgi:alpha-1,3-glucosyltransferase
MPADDANAAVDANAAAAPARQRRRPSRLLLLVGGNRAPPSIVVDWRPRILAALVCAQLLLALTPGLYRSTDFDVHRNWLAIADALPRARWYVDATSPEGTLDYPPLFAWLEWGLGRAARLLLAKEAADDILRLQAGPNGSPSCVLFQRLTVVATGLALAAAAWWASSSPSSASASTAARSHQKKTPRPPSPLLFFLITCNAGLLMVDYVHFQYNGVLLALLLASILLVERGGRGSGSGNAATFSYVLASVAFSALLNAKHLFAYAAPAFFVYLLRHYVLAADAKTSVGQKLGRLAALGAAVVGVFAASLLPFYGSLPALASRLFPFGRGLLHAYWAPNAWALYAALDKALAAVAGGLSRLRGSPARSAATANMAGGLVGVAEFAVLPQVGPRAAAAVTLVAMLPALVALWRAPPGAPARRRFAPAVAHGLLCGFLFGYHVHEKAALTFLVPMALVASAGRLEDGEEGGGEEGGEGGEEEEEEGRAAAVDFALASTAGHVGIFPLLFRPQELLLRWAAAALYFVVAARGLREEEGRRGGRRRQRRSGGRAAAGGRGAGGRLFWYSWPLVHAYAGGCVLLEAFNAAAAARLAPGLPFLPLLLTSAWCAWPLALVWLRSTAAWAREAGRAGEPARGRRGATPTDRRR